MMKTLLLAAGLLTPFSGQDTVQQTVSPQTAGHMVRAVQTITAPHAVPADFQTLNGISLDDTRTDVLKKLGKPLRVKKDMLLLSTEYQYPDVVVGMRDDVVSYVHVDPAAGRIKVNDKWLPLQRKTLDQALGGSQFTAEDGEVYVRGQRAIKVFTDKTSDKPKYVEFFDETEW
ncbi:MULTISPECIES: hypothetical protein [Paenibacillus]|uniref:hypothetical protein n=1 Tax=Paenibacillus TaxID=44249 RepID=UPI000B87F0EE|nr:MULTISPECIES: hypothetical protein [unclassified Paenibacillus]AZH31142.1 hypothetical protein EGM68_21515 [Paenibacillus sp. M-152]MEE4568657.1 hypothetical protein [Paenibacillus polymyxa]